LKCRGKLLFENNSISFFNMKVISKALVDTFNGDRAILLLYCFTAGSV
jgi:hypothetical protein